MIDLGWRTKRASLYPGYWPHVEDHVHLSFAHGAIVLDDYWGGGRELVQLIKQDEYSEWLGRQCALLTDAKAKHEQRRHIITSEHLPAWPPPLPPPPARLMLTFEEGRDLRLLRLFARHPADKRRFKALGGRLATPAARLRELHRLTKDNPDGY